MLEHDRVISREATDEIARLHDLFRIEPGGRFVENQHLRFVNQRLRETDTLSVAFGQLPARAVGHVVDVRLLHHTFDAWRALGCAQGADLQAGDERQVFAHRHVRVERRRFRQVSGAPFGFDGLV